MNCLNCNNEISNKAKYCSDKCRMAFVRANKGEQQPEQNQPEQTPNTQPEQSVVIEGYCHGCGKKHIDIKENWVNPPGNVEAGNLMCICHPCVRKGVTHKSLGLKMCDG